MVLYCYFEIEKVEYLYIAGNFCVLVDGFVLVLLGNVEKGEVLGLKLRVCIFICVMVFVDFIFMLIGFVVVS